MSKTEYQYNLFGEEYAVGIAKKKLPKSIYQIFKHENHYRESTDLKKCSRCKTFNVLDYHDKIYFKCSLLGISHSSATDISSNCVCDRYQERIAL